MAIFADDLEAEQASPEGGGGGGGARDGDELLATWLQGQVGNVLDDLSNQLPRVTDGGLLSSLLEQCMYLANSLGRVGADFSGLVLPLFEAAVCHLMETHWDAAAQRFAEQIRIRQWAVPFTSYSGGGGGGGQEGVVGSGEDGGSQADGSVAPDLTDLEDVVAGGVDAASLLPPRDLLAFASVAAYANAIIASLNDLRQIPLLGIRGHIGGLLHASLVSLGSTLDETRAAEEAGQERRLKIYAMEAESRSAASDFTGAGGGGKAGRGGGTPINPMDIAQATVQREAERFEVRVCGGGWEEGSGVRCIDG